MKTEDIQALVKTLQGVTEAASAVAGPLAAIGVPYANLAKAGLEIAKNVEQRIADGTVVATSEDHAAVQQVIADLEAANDLLNEQIEKS